MRAVIQRVSSSSVVADGVPTGKISVGLTVLLGVRKGDSERDADALAVKIAKLRIFSDENDKLNLSVKDVGGSVLVISNFTLYANYAHGNRPDYFASEAPERANELYLYFVEQLKKEIPVVETGVFGAHMDLDIQGSGPITIVMDSEVLLKKD
ncbi:MAG: D-tyrosyl-tRNA(Tyr) deacylase [Ruminococcus sp.]|nr:D-tyrosyl-tRNA(Tyr) deacylase [Candidatus Apopatosoma intestinale]